MRKVTALTLGGALGAVAAVTGLDLVVDAANAITRFRRRIRLKKTRPATTLRDMSEVDG